MSAKKNFDINDFMKEVEKVVKPLCKKAEPHMKKLCSMIQSQCSGGSGKKASGKTKKK